MVRDLREKTSAGMLDCKKALEETKGDFEAAVEWLRKKGLASAAKKTGRIAAEGAVIAKSTPTAALVLEINSETDFVARNDGFKNFTASVADHILANNPADVAALLAQTHSSGKTVEEFLRETVATIGENIVIRRFELFKSQGSIVHTYLHGEGRIGVLVEAQGSGDGARTAVNDAALHIAAMNPLSLSSDQVPATLVAKEKEILKAKALEQGKKPEMLDKIVEGQIKKWLSENCLLDQAFVKNPDVRVGEYLKQNGVSLLRFKRFELGEGLEKRSENFAEEVAAQMKGH
jgi:elongation factor Ts